MGVGSCGNSYQVEEVSTLSLVTLLLCGDHAGTLTVETSPACSVIMYVTFLTVLTEHSTSCALCSHGLSRSLHSCSTYMQGALEMDIRTVQVVAALQEPCMNSR